MRTSACQNATCVKAPRPVMYSCGLPSFVPDPVYLVKTAGAPGQPVDAVRRTMQGLEPTRAVYDARPLVHNLRDCSPGERSSPKSIPTESCRSGVEEPAAVIES